MNFKMTAPKFILGVVVFLLVCSFEVSGENCCEKLKIRSECHFLCGTITWDALLNFRCYKDYGAAVTTCKVSSAIDYVKLFSHQFSQTVEKAFEKLSSVLKQKLADAKSFATVTIGELKSLPQDLLAKLKTVSGMTPDQLKGIASRLKEFTTQNLRSFVKTVKADVLFDRIKDLAKEKWDLEQAQVFIEAAYKKYGPEVKQWTGEQIKSLGNFIKALPYKDIAKFSAKAFDSSLETLCKVTLTLDQKASMLVSAETVFGTISNWKSNQLNRLCDSIDAMTPDDILKLSAKTVEDSLTFLRTKVWDKPQVQALLKKAKEAFGEVKAWSSDQLKKLGALVAGMEPHEIAQLSVASVKNALQELGKVKWDAAQLKKIAEKVKEGLGDLHSWTRDDLMKANGILAGLSPSDLQLLNANELSAAFSSLKDVDWTPDQAAVIFKKIYSSIPIPTMTKDQVIGLGNILNQLASSDVGKFGGGILLAAFPQLKHIKGMTTPVLRKFIEEYKKSSNKNDLSLLGGIAAAMTRVELSQTDIKDILGSTEKLTGVEWNEAQIAELIDKARKELGELKKTDDIDSDSPPWGFKNLKRLGSVVLGLTKDELKSFPIRGIEDGIEALGKQLGWKRGQVMVAIERVREYLKTNNKTLEGLTEAQLAGLGSFLQGLTLTELQRLPNSAATVVVRKLGEQTGLPEDKLLSRAYWAFNVLKKKANGVLNSKEVKALGNLVAGLGSEAWNVMTDEAFRQYIGNIIRSPEFRKEKFSEAISYAKKKFGESDVGKWTGAYWRKMAPAITAMNAGEIYHINKEAFSDAIEELGEVTGFSRQQAEALVLRAKEYWKSSDVAKWTGQQLRSLGTLIKGLKVEEIKRISKTALQDIIGECSRFDNMDKEQLNAFANHAKQLFASGSMSNFDAAGLRKIWCVLTGFDAKDLEKMTLDMDLIDRLGNLTHWTKDQLQALKTNVKAYFKNHQDDYSLMSLGNILKAYTPDEIKAMSVEAFKYAAGKLSKIDGLSKEQLVALANKAKESWGEVTKWTKGQIIEGGNFIAGLSTLDISEIKPDFVDAINPKAIKMMETNQVKAFSEAQFLAMEKAQTKVITPYIRNQLLEPQLAALKATEQRDPDDANPWCQGSKCNVAGHFQPSYVTVMLSFLTMLAATWLMW